MLEVGPKIGSNLTALTISPVPYGAETRFVSATRATVKSINHFALQRPTGLVIAGFDPYNESDHPCQNLSAKQSRVTT
jgi:hypothetical protein